MVLLPEPLLSGGKRSSSASGVAQRADHSRIRRTHLNAQTYRINAIVNALNTSRHLTSADYATIGAEVLRQCDELDGVKDQVITNPYVCRPQLDILSCSQPTANQSSCLSDEKLKTMSTIYADYFSTTTGEFIFPGFAPVSLVSFQFTHLFLSRTLLVHYSGPSALYPFGVPTFPRADPVSSRNREVKV
jgi:hypothetical protein